MPGYYDRGVMTLDDNKQIKFWRTLAFLHSEISRELQINYKCYL